MGPKLFNSIIYQSQSMIWTEIFVQVCDGKMVRAHKLVLSACSPMFKSMLKNDDHPKPIIYLYGVRFSDIKVLLMH